MQKVQKYQQSQQSLTQALCSQDEAKDIARMIWDMYHNGQDIGQSGLKQMLQDTFSFMQQSSNPGQQEIQDFQQIIVNQKGSLQVTLEDLEQQCICYLAQQQQQQQYQSPPATGGKREWLDQRRKVAEKYFKQYDKGQGYITKDQVAKLVHDTFAEIGVEKNPTENEVDSFIEFTDTDKDGKISLQEYLCSMNEAMLELAAEQNIE